MQIAQVAEALPLRCVWARAASGTSSSNARNNAPSARPRCRPGCMP